MILRRTLLLGTVLLAACAAPPAPREAEPTGPAEVQRLIGKWAARYEIPESLLTRVVREESTFNPAARNGPYWGLMQIHPQTAATMGHRGPPEALLDADTNLRFGARYLRGAWLVARGDPEGAIGWYRRGYYYEAKRLGLLEETGLR
ncbi:MAG: lytic transglycosylase domain-containing protein [Rhodobacteraceae bacterium]|nr:lytic transglycosylase domain-containing protein [Paracoccaceae bacterium]